jgi:uncharacterized protein YdhG (YjbR/CyaY superfamily)
MLNFESVDQYISTFPKDTQKQLTKIRKAIKAIVPKDTEEKISYGIPTFKLKKNLVHYAAYKNHIGFYPGAQAVIEFMEEVKRYNWTKGTIQFPIDKPMPIELILKITKYRIQKVNDDF